MADEPLSRVEGRESRGERRGARVGSRETGGGSRGWRVESRESGVERLESGAFIILYICDKFLYM